jgi:ADYC domain
MRSNPKQGLALCLLATFGLAALGAKGAVADNVIRAIGAEGTAFRVELSDGSVLYSPDLVGAVLGIELGERIVRLRIDAVERDATIRDNIVWLHSFSVEQPDSSWQNLCKPPLDGRAQGFPLAGRTRGNGTLDTSDKKPFSLVCSSSVQAKCVRFGYAPWAQAPDGASLQPAFDACVTMLRADYAGNNSPTTREGTRIDVSDRWNIRAIRGEDSEYAFEAGWDANGAVCVHHPRILENISLANLSANVPRLKGRTGAICTEAFARAHGALVFNRSRISGQATSFNKAK